MKRMLVSMAVLVLAIGWAAWADVDVHIETNTTGFTEVYQQAAGPNVSVQEFIRGWTASLIKNIHISGGYFWEGKDLTLDGGCFYQLAEIGGPNWQYNPHGYWRIEDPTPIDTAFIYEEICGEGLEIHKDVESCDAYHLFERKDVTGTDLDIYKFVGWWTNTRDPEDSNLTEINVGLSLSGPNATLNGDLMNLHFNENSVSERVALITPDQLDLGINPDDWQGGQIDYLEFWGHVEGEGAFWERVLVNPDLCPD